VAKRRNSRARVIQATEPVTVCGAPRDLQYDPDVAQEVGAEDAPAAAD
jgi:hypothetical protein